MTERKPTTDAVEIFHRLFIKDDPERLASLEAEEMKCEIAQKMYDLRETAGLTQAQLARKVGTTAQMIENLEMTDYDSHQLCEAVLMLKRIAKALGKRIDVDFRVVPLETGER